MPKQKNTIIFVHGLWDDSRVFKKLIDLLDSSDLELLTPTFPHKFGRTSIKKLAQDLDKYVLESCGSEIDVDLLGFSMGGLIGRFWIQNLGGARRVRRFLSVGSPHNGTLTAQLIPSWLLSGVSEMKRGSSLLRDLNEDLTLLKEVDCISFFSTSDLMVFPGSEAKLPIGISHSIPVLTHKELISHPASLSILKKELLKND